MTERLDITRAQVKALAIAAKEVGCTVEVERKDGTIFRVIPDIKKPREPEPLDDAKGVAL